MTQFPSLYSQESKVQRGSVELCLVGAMLLSPVGQGQGEGNSGPHVTVSCWSGPPFIGSSILLFLFFRDVSSSDGSITADAGSVMQMQRDTGERRHSKGKRVCFVLSLGL